MAIIECRDCKKTVSTSAEVCPNCGAKYPASYIPSKVTINRSGLIGFAVAMTVLVDGQNMGKLKKDGEITLTLPYGDHTLSVKGPFWGTFSGQTIIKILPAKIYRIEISLRNGFPEHHATFQVYFSET